MAKGDKTKDGGEVVVEQSSAPAPELQPVSALAVKHGHTFHKRGKDGKLYPSVPEHDSLLKPAHLIADVTHGWTFRKSLEHVEVALSDDDYLAAIEAAKAGKTHAPAMRYPADHFEKMEASRAAAKGK